MADSGPASPAASSLTVDIDVPSAQVLADQAAIIQDLQFVMESCRRLLSELATPEAERDAVVPLALWSAALVAYARCFSSGKRFGLTTQDIEDLPLEGEVLKFHKWIIEERNRHTRHTANPFEAARVGIVLVAPPAKQRIEGVTVLSASHVLVDDTGVRQLGGLASELAKQTAERAKTQQDAVVADAKKIELGKLYELPPLPTGPADPEAGPESGPEDDADEAAAGD
jgi:hypothetical protein